LFVNGGAKDRRADRTAGTPTVISALRQARTGARRPGGSIRATADLRHPSGGTELRGLR
jgi:hypothetical protein